MITCPFRGSVIYALFFLFFYSAPQIFEFKTAAVTSIKFSQVGLAELLCDHHLSLQLFFFE